MCLRIIYQIIVRIAKIVFSVGEIKQLNVLIDIWHVYNHTPYPHNRTVREQFVDHFRKLHGDEDDTDYKRCNAIHEYIDENRRHA